MVASRSDPDDVRAEIRQARTGIWNRPDSGQLQDPNTVQRSLRHVLSPDAGPL